VKPICLPTGELKTKDMEEEVVYMLEKQEPKPYYRYGRPYYNSRSYHYDSYGNRVYYTSTETPDNATVDPTAPTTTVGPCKSCSRRRNKLWIDYRADMVLDKSECISKLAEGIECSECQYSTEGTMCAGGDIKDYDRCNRQLGAPVIYENSNKFYLVGIVVRNSWYCQDPALTINTKIADHMTWILDNMIL